MQILKIYFKIFILLLPLLLIVASFLIFDPFGIIHVDEPKYESSGDYQTTRLYLKNTRHIDYNSFIFGNSKTLAFTSNHWKKHVKNGVFYKFGAPGESIFNIYNKIRLIAEKGDRLDNALFVLDLAMIKNCNNRSPTLRGPVYKHHPYTQDENWLTFYASFFTYYLADYFFIRVINEELFKHGEQTTPIKNFLLTKEDYNKNTNEFYLRNLEEEIISKGFSEYYKAHENQFKVHKNSDNSQIRLKEQDIYFLSEINKELIMQKCKFKIILGLNLKDERCPAEIVTELNRIFGPKNVFDYSIPSKITTDSSYYYEHSHCRPVAGELILDEIYGDPSIKSEK